MKYTEVHRAKHGGAQILVAQVRLNQLLAAGVRDSVSTMRSAPLIEE